MTTSVPIPFGARVRELRLRQVLTQRELAAKAGVTPDTVNRIEKASRGANLPQQATIRKLAKALGVKPAQLVAPEGELPY